MVIESGNDLISKARWRAQLLAARAAVPASVRAAEARALADAVLSIPGDIVCCYVPIGREPGSVALLDAQVAAGRRVLLPVVRDTGPLDWADYRGPDGLRSGPFALREPDGERLGPEALGWADAVFVPALAIDHSGIRLGRGAGHYDRSLPLARPGIPLVAVVRDAEVVDTLPAEPHDVRVTAVLTPGGGLRWLR